MNNSNFKKFLLRLNQDYRLPLQQVKLAKKKKTKNTLPSSSSTTSPPLPTRLPPFFYLLKTLKMSEKGEFKGGINLLGGSFSMLFIAII